MLDKATVNAAVEGLDLVAGVMLPARLSGKLERDDLLQEVLVRAHKAECKFDPTNEAEIRAYLRKSVASVLIDLIKHFATNKRLVARERSLQAILDDSSARIEEWLAADQTTPSQRAVRNEQLICLAQALALLPDDQRRAIELHHLQGLSLNETSLEMKKNRPAVAGLLRRGLGALRERLAGAEEA